MESHSLEQAKQVEKQDAIRQQIALLQAQLDNAPEVYKKAKSAESTPVILAPSTPPAKKRKVDHFSNDNTVLPKPAFKRHVKPPAKQATASKLALNPGNDPSTSSASFLSQLHRINPKSLNEADILSRSAGFSDVACVATKETIHPLSQGRNEDLTLIEDIEPGPIEYPPPLDDPLFEKFEPNSGIHLSTRKLPHEDLQEYLRGRYYLSPSRLYSVVRLLPNKQAYDVPVAGDWVTIAVIAERGPIKVSSANTTSNSMASDDEGTVIGLEKPKNAKKSKPGSNDNRGESKRKSGKKYMSIKLVDFGHRGKSSSNDKAVIKGDALLTLLLFESDSFDILKDKNGKTRKLYKGGSRGAFEEFAKLREGMVIALMNPKILKPFNQQRSHSAPHPLTNALALTPESAQSIAYIGESRDLGMCHVKKRDGKVCGGWCDKRVSDVCEYHITTAIQNRRASRAEFSVGTSGMTTSASKRKGAYDPSRQWGLTPESKGPDGEATYILPGHVVSSRGSEFLSEKLGRESQARAKRKLDAQESERTLNQLLKQDKRFAQVVQLSKPVPTPQTEDQELAKRRTYSVSMIKRLGFDPTLRVGQKAHEHLIMSGAQPPKRNSIHLGPPPGERKRSGVTAPRNLPDSISGSQRNLDRPTRSDDTDDTDDDFERQEKEVFGHAFSQKATANLETRDDDDSSDLEIDPMT